MTVGIINSQDCLMVIDEYHELLDAQDRLGIKIVIVGAGHDMTSPAMRMIIESERFEVVQQRPLGWSRSPRNNRNGDGPRDKWGKLK